MLLSEAYDGACDTSNRAGGDCNDGCCGISDGRDDGLKIGPDEGLELDDDLSIDSPLDIGDSRGYNLMLVFCFRSFIEVFHTDDINVGLDGIIEDIDLVDNDTHGSLLLSGYKLRNRFRLRSRCRNRQGERRKGEKAQKLHCLSW